MDIEERKQKIIEKYGKEPTICLYYYVWNAVDYIGEDRLRESFESVIGQGDEIILADYGSDDGTVEIAKEYGFKIINVEKTEGILFYESKLANAVINETKCNFIFDMDIHTVFPSDLTERLRNWIMNNDISKEQLVLRGLFCKKNGEFRRFYSVCSSCLIYRPFLIETIGYDERTYYGYGTSHYAIGLLTNVLKLKFYDLEIDDMLHRFHMETKIKRWKDIFKIEEDHRDSLRKHQISLEVGRRLLRKFKGDFDEAIKKVKNSYWGENEDSKIEKEII